MTTRAASTVYMCVCVCVGVCVHPLAGAKPLYIFILGRHRRRVFTFSTGRAEYRVFSLVLLLLPSRVYIYTSVARGTQGAVGLARTAEEEEGEGM